MNPDDENGNNKKQLPITKLTKELAEVDFGALKQIASSLLSNDGEESKMDTFPVVVVELKNIILANEIIQKLTNTSNYNEPAEVIWKPIDEKSTDEPLLHEKIDNESLRDDQQLGEMVDAYIQEQRTLRETYLRTGSIPPEHYPHMLDVFDYIRAHPQVNWQEKEEAAQKFLRSWIKVENNLKNMLLLQTIACRNDLVLIQDMIVLAHLHGSNCCGPSFGEYYLETVFPSEFPEETDTAEEIDQKVTENQTNGGRKRPMDDFLEDLTSDERKLRNYCRRQQQLRAAPESQDDQLTGLELKLVRMWRLFADSYQDKQFVYFVQFLEEYERNSDGYSKAECLKYCSGYQLLLDHQDPVLQFDAFALDLLSTVDPVGEAFLDKKYFSLVFE